MTMIAYAFLQHQRLQTAKREKRYEEFVVGRLNRPCQPSVEPSSMHVLYQQQGADVRTFKSTPMRKFNSVKGGGRYPAMSNEAKVLRRKTRELKEVVAE
jgi:hypothetical protein